MLETEGRDFRLPDNTERQRIILPHEISVAVRRKRGRLEQGTTPYYLSYSFKGEQEGSPIIPNKLIKIIKN